MSKMKKSRSLARRGPKRKPYSKVLVVCEGKKTEPNYFNGLKNALKLNTAKVVIVGQGANPLQILKCAKAQCKKEERAGDAFDKVYCVFDKDEHVEYGEAVDKINAIKNYEAITSVPAFEYWLILHYTYTDKPYNNASTVRDDLKKHMPEYDKSDSSIFSKLQDKLQTAKKNAEKSLHASKQNDTDNPSTQAHKLVGYMEELRDEQSRSA